MRHGPRQPPCDISSAGTLLLWEGTYGVDAMDNAVGRNPRTMEQKAASPHRPPGTPPRVYLAGPDIFFRDSAAIYERLKAACAQYGLQGVEPSDGGVHKGFEGSEAEQDMLLGRIKEALVRQTVEKEWVLYPALRLSGEAGEAAADRLATDYAEVKAALFELEQTPSEDPLWRSRMGALRDRLVAHTREEEEEVFPALRKTLTAEEDARLTQLVNVEGRRFV